ncbi:MAG: TatD family deoxyribonuclease [Sphingobacteriales bacterium]|nr:MAG: TatD family deoxyribonuclease [Sphingobacteriales bacterium]
MITFIDTHTHLYDPALTVAGEDPVQRAVDAGVVKMYMPNCDSATIDDMLEIESRWPENCFPMIGLHPCYVKENVEAELAHVGEWLEERPFAAVGEIGLDKYWDLTFFSQQQMAFRFQIDLALRYDRPVVIHSREATMDCIEIVREKQQGSLKGIFHCFGGTAEEARMITELGFYLGIGGVVTFKNSNLGQILEHVSLESLVLETDAPYLAPVPYRGKRNESAYLPLIAQKIADIKRVSLEEVARITSANAEIIFA